MHNSFPKRWALPLIVIALICGMEVRAYGQIVKPPVGVPRGGMDGVLQPFLDVDVATTETGIVSKMLVSPGERVVAGQPIAELESRMLQDQIAVKETEATARGRIEQAESEMKLSQSKFEKISKLKEQGHASAAEFERAEIDYLVAKGRFAAENDQLRLLQMDLRRIKNMLDERTIRAPIDGIVTEVIKQSGEFVAPNSPNLVRIVNVSKVIATFFIQESELKTLQVGSKVKVRLSNGTTMEGVVNYLPPIAEPQSGLFLVTILFENPEELTLGSSCQRIP